MQLLMFFSIATGSSALSRSNDDDAVHNRFARSLCYMLAAMFKILSSRRSMWHICYTRLTRAVLQALDWA